MWDGKIEYSKRLCAKTLPSIDTYILSTFLSPRSAEIFGNVDERSVCMCTAMHRPHAVHAFRMRSVANVARPVWFLFSYYYYCLSLINFVVIVRPRARNVRLSCLRGGFLILIKRHSAGKDDDNEDLLRLRLCAWDDRPNLIDGIYCFLIIVLCHTVPLINKSRWKS